MERLNIDDLDLEHIDQISEIEWNVNDSGSAEDKIAVIGIAGKIGKAESVQEFWEYLKDGEDFYQQLSDERRIDADNYDHTEWANEEKHYIEGALLRNISNFDYEFFGLSMQEAKCMDPNQRLLLENTWKALEDAGYAGNKIKGTHTGVFVGYSADFGMNYRNMIHNLDPEINELAVANNVASMMASRISYQFDLGGPAMMIDTACSSGLMAVYEACQAIQKKDCDMAIAGSVKCNVYPVWYDKKNNEGVRIISDTQSKDKVTNTYDENASGTFLAEGVVTFVLKPLEQAKRDRDHIYAVILGGSRNQDGRSNGITAPNLKAQKELLLKAWENAGILPEQLRFIENHGTATKLGDPIEIRAITEAFKKYTNKKQICGVGSLKTNIGHMDHASGMAGLLKLVLSLENGEIPRSIHFRQPNGNIDFINMPVYVADRDIIIADKNETIVGINSFGISGTNCHLVLQGYEDSEAKETAAKEVKEFIVPISAKNKEALKILVGKYTEYLENSQNDLQDFLYTVIMGRMHFDCRLCIVAYTREQIIEQMKRFLSGQDAYESEEACYMYGKHKMVAGSHQLNDNLFEITIQAQEELSRKQHKYASLQQFGESLKTWMQAYVKGADIPWESYADRIGGKVVSLDTYPFRQIKCWVKEEKENRRKSDRQVIHTLPMDIVIEQCDIEKNWELREHTLNNNCILPGTALVNKMITYVRTEYEEDRPVVLKNIQFETPFGVAKGEQKELQMLVKKEKDICSIQFSSTDGNSWDIHASGEYHKNLIVKNALQYDIEEWKKRISVERAYEEKKDAERGIKVSDRWSKDLRKCWSTSKRDEFLFELELTDKYKKEVEQYKMHPALFDIAVNAVSGCIEEDKTYLPFSYGKIVFFQDLPARIYVYARKRKGEKGSEIYSFDLIISDTSGKCIAEIENYSIKRLPKEDFYLQRKVALLKAGYFCLGVAECGNDKERAGRVLYCGRKDNGLFRSLLADPNLEIDYIDLDQDNVKQKLSEYQHQKYTFGIYNSTDASNDDIYRSVQKCVDFLQAVTLKKMDFLYGISIIAKNSANVTSDDKNVIPVQAAVLGAAGVMGRENEKLRIRCFDVDDETEERFLQYDFSNCNQDVIFVRKGRIYERRFEEAEEKSIDVNYEPQGAVIVSGGMGQLGIRVCNMLKQKGIENILAIGHKKRARSEELATGIETFDVNLEDRDEVEKICEYAKNKYGYVEGIIHMAGKPGDGFALLKEAQAFYNVYAGKAIGAFNLYQATSKEKLKFMIMFSSVASLARDPGQSDYTAANMFLDALAEKAGMENRRCVSVLWPPFDKIGMAHYMNAIGKNADFTEIQVDEAMDILYRIIIGQVQDATVLLPDKRKFQKAKKLKQKPDEKEIIILGTTEEDDVIKKVAQIWCNTLDIKELDVNDEFIKLGGNSLLSTVMLKEYQKIYPEVMEIADLFSYTTANKQADYIRKKMGINKPVKEAGLNKSEDISKKDKEEKVTDLLDALLNGSRSVEESLKFLE